MIRIVVLIFAFILSSCSRGESIQKYSSCVIGQTYVVQRDLLALKYDYMQIPLVKPGFQLFDVSKEKLKDARPEMKIELIGVVHKGDVVKINSYVEEGGWIPCKGNWYMANPMVEIMTGELSGKTVGISLLCEYKQENAVEYKQGKMGFMKIQDDYLVPAR